MSCLQLPISCLSRLHSPGNNCFSVCFSGWAITLSVLLYFLLCLHICAMKSRPAMAVEHKSKYVWRLWVSINAFSPRVGPFCPPSPVPPASCRVRIVGNSSLHARSEVWFINYSGLRLFWKRFHIWQHLSFEFWLFEFMRQMVTPSRPHPDVGAN